MEEIQSMKNLISMRKTRFSRECEDEMRKKTEEYNDTMKQLKDIREERWNYHDSIAKNSNDLIVNKIAVQKLLHDSDNAPALPISHDYHEQAVQLFSDASDFINNFKASNGPMNTLKTDNIDARKLTNDIVTCTNKVEKEFYKAQSALLHIKKLKDNIEVLQNFNTVPDDEDAHSNSS